MNKILLVFLIICTLSTGCENKKKMAHQNKGEIIEIVIEDVADSLLKDPKINAVSIGVIKDKKFYSAHYGELKKGKGNKPTDTTIYEIASVSKSFTGTLVAQAVLDKKIDLDDDIRKYLTGNFSNLEYDGKPIKIKHLVTHTAGLPRFLPKEINELFNTIDENLPFRINAVQKEYNKEKFLSDLQSITLDHMPGTTYVYSNCDTELMAHILENVYEMSFEELLQKYICEIAEMDNTKVHLSEKEVDYLANGYGENNNNVPHFANTLWGAGGGIKSTTRDLLNYMKFQLDEKNLAANESHKVVYTDDNMQMAYLWPVLDNSEYGKYYVIHGGAFGMQNYLLIVPKYKLGISIITNQSGPNTQGKLWNALNDLLVAIIKL